MELMERVARANRALEIARLPEAETITTAVQLNQVVGVLGEGDVGKTETIGQALGPSNGKLAVVRLDLAGAGSDAHVAFRLALGICRALVDGPQLSVLKVGALVPASLESRRLELAELLGVDGLEEAMRDWPSGEYGLPRALSALEDLARDRGTILWVDHLEAPGLTPRHPLKTDRLLWSLRELGQRLSGLTVVLSGRVADEGTILGPKAAFHQQGQWLSLDNPPATAWMKVARDLRIEERDAAALVELTRGHPETTLLAMLEMQRADSVPSAEEALRRLGSAGGALTARAIQHARTLHRLGEQVLVQVALGMRPYGIGQRGSSPQQEITKVLRRLRQAGLLRHDGNWSVVDPRIAMAVSGRLQGVVAPDTLPADEAAASP